MIRASRPPAAPEILDDTVLYLPALFLLTSAPLGGLNTILTHTTVIHLRLDYLLNALMFMPLSPLWRLGFSRHPFRLIIPAGLALAVGLEGVQYLLSYRAWNVNDAIGNGGGFCCRRSSWACEDLRGFENLAGPGRKCPPFPELVYIYFK